LTTVINKLTSLADTSGPCDMLRHTQLSPCCAQGRTLNVIDRWWSSVDFWQHLVSINVPVRNYSWFRGRGKAPEGIMLIFGDIWILYFFHKHSAASVGFKQEYDVRFCTRNS